MGSSDVASDTEPTAASATHGPDDSTILRLRTSTVRRYRASDAEDIVRAGSSAAVIRFMSNRFPNPYTLELAQKWIETSNAEPVVNWAICTAGSDVVVGDCALNPGADVEARTMVLGYWLSSEVWGRGIMTDVVANLTRWAFDSYPDLLKLEATAFSENIGSISVLKKAGFQHEGTRRHAAFKDGKVIDVVLYGYTRQDYEARHPPSAA